MNWVVLSLPLIASLSVLLATAGLYIAMKESFKNFRVPEVSVKEPDVSHIEEAFSRVFPPIESPARTGGEESTVAVYKNLKLIGTAVGVKSLALLKVGDKVLVLEEGSEKKGIKLKKVYRNSALIVIKGRELRLKLESPKLSGGGGATGGIPSGSSELRISRREIERITTDPGIMFREIRLVPYVKNGRTEGFIFEWIKPGSLFYKAGIRKGDILVSINNMTIKSGEDAFKVLQVLRNEPSLRVVVLRGGQRKEINVRIE